MVGLYVIVGLIDALFVAQAIHALTNHGDTSTVPWMLLIAFVMLLLPLPFIVQRRWWVARIGPEGVTLRSGRLFLWQDYMRTEPRFNHRLRIINNYEMIFRTGTAGVFHRMAENQLEIEAVMQQMQQGLNPFVPR